MLSNKKIINVTMGSILSATWLLLGKMNPYFSILILMFLGLNLSSYICEKISLRVSFAGALGVSVLVIIAYILSILQIGLSPLMYLILILSSITFNFDYYKKISRKEFVSLGKLLFIIGVIVGIRALIFKIPTDSVDSVAHAYKIQYIIKYSTMFPPKIPKFDLLSYPGGYHILVAWITILSNDVIPHSMLVARVWSWIFIIMGTYLLGTTWFGERVGIRATMLILVTNIYNYYLIPYIHPNFLSFYFFMCTLSLFYLVIHNRVSEHSKKFAQLFLVLLGTATLFVHPYMFQAYVFVIAVYLLLKLYSKELQFKNAILAGIKYFAFPVIIYALLNPYFWWPELASKVIIEYPWVSYPSITAENLVILRGKPPSDTWEKLQFTIDWLILRNLNYLPPLLLVASLIIPIKRKYRVKEVLSLWSFVIFVIILLINRVTYNLPIPFYGSASMERIFLWTTPLVPILVSLGFSLLLQPFSKENSLKMFKILEVVFLVSLFLIPAKGIAYDMISDEANYYVDLNNINDFQWINEKFSGAIILNSCYTDAGQWIPFFTSNKVLFSYLNYCRIYNITPKTSELLITNKSSFLNATLAYIDTNYPSLNPLIFYDKFRLLRLNEGNWIFDLTSNDTSENEKILKTQLSLPKDYISGNIYEDGKYYVYGFRKKYFMVQYFHLQGLDYAWLKGEKGIILFVPLENYTKVSLSFLYTSPTSDDIVIKLNNASYIVRGRPGKNFYEFTGNISSRNLNKIELIKNDTKTILIEYIKFEK